VIITINNVRRNFLRPAVALVTVLTEFVVSAFTGRMHHDADEAL
jgi:hypothetical protein